ncbi:signal recognition particle receptor beta subunit domain-containing protein [Ditylenchus destructor]|nr:signal recognition particle receptor beta subunit domain-containing protein [Ditylenchus destructor]
MAVASSSKTAKYVVVKLASVISGSTIYWIRPKAGEKAATIAYDKAIGQSVLFKESEKVKSKSLLFDHVKKKFGITEMFVEGAKVSQTNTGDSLLMTVGGTTFLIPALATFALLLLTVLIYLFWRRYASRADAIILVGLNDSGKTRIFTKLIDSGNNWSSYTSMKENLFTEYLTKNGSRCRLVDYPGAESLRKNLFLKWFNTERKNIKCIVFVVDSSTFSANSKDVAAFMYDALYESRKSVPLLIACNKQDLENASTTQNIRNELEKEFGLINVSRQASLSSTDGDSSKRLLTENGADFRWNDLRGTKFTFIECSANDDEPLDEVISYIDSL